MDKLKSLLGLITAIVTVGGLIIGGATSYARLQDKSEAIDKKVEKHEEQIKEVETAITEQRADMKYIKESQKEVKEDTKEMLKLMRGMKSTDI